MKKNDYIYNGSALYRISKIENNLVKVVPTSRKDDLFSCFQNLSSVTA